MKNPLLKIQELPKSKRKAVFWVVMIIMGLSLSGLYARYIQKKVAGANLEGAREEMSIHSLEEMIDKIREIEIPKIEMPEINQEALQELQRMMEEMPQEITEETEEMPIENNHNGITE